MTSKTLSRLALGASAATVGALLAVPLLATAASAATIQPTVTSVSPTSGPNTGGTNVTITGTGFEDSTTGAQTVSNVNFGGAVATGFVVQSPTQILATSPGGTGPVAVYVTNTAGHSDNTATAADTFTYVTAPTVAGVTPQSGASTGGTTVTIFGSGFQNSGTSLVSAVKFGDTASTNVIVNSNNKLTAVSPVHAAGPVDITVTTPSGTSAASPSSKCTAQGQTATGLTPNCGDTFTYFAQPTISSLSASTGSVYGSGSYTPTTQGTYTSANPATTAPTGGTAASTNQQANGQIVTITGTGFEDSNGSADVSSVMFGHASAANFAVLSPTTLEVSVPAEDASDLNPPTTGAPTTVDVIVTTAPPGNNSGGAATTAKSAGAFTYTSAPAVQLIGDGTTAGSNAGPTTGGKIVVIKGGGLTDSTNKSLATSVTFGGVAATAVVGTGANTITAVAPMHSAGPVDVVVTTSAGTSDIRASDTYYYDTGVPPTAKVTSFSPAGGPAGQSTPATITGSTLSTTDFITNGSTTSGTGAPAATGGALLNFVVPTSTKIDADTFPSGNPGQHNVTVCTQENGCDSTTTFSTTAAPTVTNVNPDNGTAAGGTSVTISGTGFTNVSAVTFGDTAAQQFSTATDSNGVTTVTAISPAHAAGTVDVTVTAAGGTSKASPNADPNCSTVTPTAGVGAGVVPQCGDSFTFTGPSTANNPTVTNVNPNTGKAAGGDSVTITGSNFVTGSTTVKFGTVAATNVTVNTASSLTATTPAENPGTVSVTVTTPNGTSSGTASTGSGTSNGNQFTFTGTGTAPTVTSVSPTSGSFQGGTTVTIKGTNLGDSSTATVTFGSNTASIVSNDGTTLVVTSPAGTSGATVPVTVTVGGQSNGTSTAASFTYTGATSDYLPQTPSRILSDQVIASNSTVPFTLPSSVPAGTGAVALNLTAVHPNTVGNLRVNADCGSSTPTSTSILNYQPGEDTANFVIVPLQCSAGSAPVRTIDFYSANSGVTVDVDLAGTYPTTTTGTGASTVYTTPGFTGITPVRDVTQQSIPANTSKKFTLTDVPNGAKAVAINVTSIHQPGEGNLRVYPGDQTAVPTTSNVNFIPGVDKAGFVIINLPADKTINIFSAGSTDSVDVDVFGAFPAGASTTGLAQPVRVLNTRTGVGPTQGLPDPLQIGTPYNVTVTGNGVPADATAVVVSLTSEHAAGSTGVGNLRAYPAGGTTPNVSNLNYISPKADVANLAIVRIGSNGQITLVTNGSVINAAVDVLGYVPAPKTTP